MFSVDILMHATIFFKMEATTYPRCGRVGRRAAAAGRRPARRRPGVRGAERTPRTHTSTSRQEGTDGSACVSPCNLRLVASRRLWTAHQRGGSST